MPPRKTLDAPGTATNASAMPPPVTDSAVPSVKPRSPKARKTAPAKRVVVDAEDPGPIRSRSSASTGAIAASAAALSGALAMILTSTRNSCASTAIFGFSSERKSGSMRASSSDSADADRVQRAREDRLCKPKRVRPATATAVRRACASSRGGTPGMQATNFPSAREATKPGAVPCGLSSTTAPRAGSLAAVVLADRTACGRTKRSAARSRAATVRAVRGRCPLPRQRPPW